jgi:hypothetical protein
MPAEEISPSFNNAAGGDMNVLERMARTGEAAWHRTFPLETVAKYWLFFAITCAISLLLILLSYSALKETMPSGNLASDVKDLAHQVKIESACIFADLKYKITERDRPCIPEKRAPESEKKHTPTISSGILQIVGVVVISFLWFYTFSLKRQKYMFWSVVATCAYVFGMFNAYQPAVLVAALVAIFVAAEHFGKLSEQEKILEVQGEQLNKSRKALTETDYKLRSVVKKVLRISNSIQLSLNKAGIEIFMQEVYESYSRARTIYAVLRDHKIEKEWWDHAEMAFAAGQDLAAVWTWYEAAKPAESKRDRRMTLYMALTEERDGSVPGSDKKVGEGGIGIQSAYFVSSMAMPETDEWKECDPVELFEDLLGLAWECLVLDRVRKKLHINDSIGEWISKPLCWTHATDKEVWQLIRRNKFADSIVVKTADIVAGNDSQLNRKLSENVIESTQAEIRRYLRRGVPAEEYLSAVLCYARIDDADAVLHGADIEIVYNNIHLCLCKINMKAWLKSTAAENDYRKYSLAEEGMKIREKICVAIFKEFIEMCWNKPVAGKDVACERLNTSLLLAQEVL